ncbi:hypothetical protein TNIN_278281 [Trichonephila inaurata madagascariensis]|uniref:Uncharacterized protein n=1 Tax=Trichonephila inaurata madagascariensis TaxID=2747483 RepID=A0A8X6JRE2_9ARAC|nr:hypothetical protein TNIN_278281 [Trichonephila inaurata madagascariensis]
MYEIQSGGRTCRILSKNNKDQPRDHPSGPSAFPVSLPRFESQTRNFFHDGQRGTDFAPHNEFILASHLGEVERSTFTPPA